MRTEHHSLSGGLLFPSSRSGSTGYFTTGYVDMHLVLSIMDERPRVQ
jgi:hypothetical protein